MIPVPPIYLSTAAAEFMVSHPALLLLYFGALVAALCVCAWVAGSMIVEWWRERREKRRA